MHRYDALLLATGGLTWSEALAEGAADVGLGNLYVVNELLERHLVQVGEQHHLLERRSLAGVDVDDDAKALACGLAAVAGARAMGFRGFNCTIPHKVAVVPLMRLYRKVVTPAAASR